MSEQEKLDPFSKILLATQTINFLANNINAVMQDIKTIGVRDEKMAKQLAKSLADKEDYLASVVEDLSEIMQDIGDYCNNADLLSGIDIRITEAAFDILKGNDALEQDVDDDLELKSI